MILDLSQHLHEMQIFFDKNNATKMCLQLICESNNFKIEEDLLNELLSFFIKLLEGGNLVLQNSIYNNLVYHSVSETLFWKFHSIINEAVIYFNEEKKETHFSEIKYEILLKVLRILQLFVEGHNLKMQIYMKTQKSGGNNYDMLAVIVDLLEVCYRNLNIETSEICKQCFQSLIDFVQV
jgi:hypothetical protein